MTAHSEPSSSSRRVIVALDYANPADAVALARKLDPKSCRLKVGKELFTRGGPAVVEQLVEFGFDVFLDLKFHDIPNTVAKACAAAAELGVWMMNVHTLGGRRMMEAAKDAVANIERRPLITGVTILTSMAQQDIAEVGLQGAVSQNVERLAQLAKDAGLDGVVCSPHEATLLKEQFGKDFCLVTPGIRPAGVQASDQRRVTTPSDAIRAGADYLVIGRPVTAADDPLKALEAINSEIRALV